MEREALMLLGLSGEPGLEEIRKAYLTKSTQPRFSTIVFENAELSRDFSRLHEAYVGLLRHMAEAGTEISAPSSPRDIFQLVFNQGVYFMIQQNFIRAGEKFQEASRIQPGEPWVQLYLGILLLKRRNFYAAEKYLTQACRQLPGQEYPWLYLADTYEHAGNPRAAAHALRKAMEINPARQGIAGRIKTLETRRPKTSDHSSLLDRLLKRR